MNDTQEATTIAETPPVFHTRGYQQELLEESLRSNIVVALNTGSGKTYIAVLRMKHEIEREPRKVSWFLVPTVALVEQQWAVINTATGPVGKISGASYPEKWTSKKLWRSILESYKIVVSTPMVLLDALRHGYIDLGMDIGLLVFDEAHHAVKNNPYNRIMQDFYMKLDKRTRYTSSMDRVRPMVLGLTASPMYGGDPDAAFARLEGNLDSIIRSTQTHTGELAQYVYTPLFKHVLYDPAPYWYDTLPSDNLFSLRTVVDSLNIQNDPHILTLRGKLARARPASAEWRRLDQTLSETIIKADTFTHRGLREFVSAAEALCMDVGEWAADWFIAKVIESARRADPQRSVMFTWQANDRQYLLQNLEKVSLVPVSNDPDEIRRGLTPKVQALIACLIAEEQGAREYGETYSGLVFVERRATVIALAEVLSRLPETVQLFRVGRLLGGSASVHRRSFLDITREIVKESHTKTLEDFRGGKKNLIVSTSVGEEGIDIQACGSVIRYDPPQNVVAWAQSRGRARRKRSTFVMMLEQGKQHELIIQKWIDIERRMTELYTDPSRVLPAMYDDEDEDERIFCVESTGAILSLGSVTSHLNHFCAVLPNTSHEGQLALYDLDPPDYPENWHSQQDRLRNMPPYAGPWGATVTLPRCLPSHLRTFSTKREHRTKRLAQKHAAFDAYIALYQAKLLNDHLLPVVGASSAEDGVEINELLADIEKRASMENVSLQLDPWASTGEGTTWWKSELTVDGLPTLIMLTQNALPEFTDEQMPIIYIPGRGATRVLVRPLGTAEHEESYIGRARVYTRRVFSILHSSRLKPDDEGFAYIFHPKEDKLNEHAWQDRRRWHEARLENGPVSPQETRMRANADALRQKYGLLSDLALIRPHQRFKRPLEFVDWVQSRLSPEEEEMLRERYSLSPNATITYPLLQAREFPYRTNFLVPLSSTRAGLARGNAIYLLPQYATVELVSKEDLQYAMYLPSILRRISSAMTVMSIRNELFSGSSVAQIPFDFLRMAITSPAAGEKLESDLPYDYQRLETLGDCVLKCLVSIQLYADHPWWHEGFLSKRRAHAISNAQLAKAALRKKLYKWIIRDQLQPKKWKPRYLSDSAHGAGAQEAAAENPDAAQALSTKVLADVVESLLGAAYVHGGFDQATECAALFGLGLSWKNLLANVDDVLRRHEELNDAPPPQLQFVEQMIGYTFTRKSLLIQALTHASYSGDLETMSYERLEYLGDCLLDMIVTSMLYHAEGRNYSPGQMHMRKEACVNAHFLAYFCLRAFVTCASSMPSWSPATGITIINEDSRVYLWQCLLHSSHRILEEQTQVSQHFDKVGSTIEAALRERPIYPWAALTGLQAPKFFSDVVESLLGAVFVDSEGDFTAVCDVLRALGIMETIERIVMHDEMDVRHPISQLHIWASKEKPPKKVRIEVDKIDEEVVCVVHIDEEEIVKLTQGYRSRASQEEIRFAAAEQALHKVRAAGNGAVLG